MKKIALITFTFIISFTLFSQQKEFEKTLGKENVETLNSLIENFETKTLKNKYPNLKTENAYKEFLKDILKYNYSLLENKIFPESKLKLNIYCVSDSTWVEERELSSGKKSEMIKTKYKCLNRNGKVIYSSSISYCCNEKSKTLKHVENQKEDVQINFNSIYLKALEEIPNKSKFVEYYLENIKMTADPIHPFWMSQYILKNDIDINDYFTKRLIFINMFYR
tara:strand:+ start:133 stop:798 length:666 start_codon:yes stop_codon:yes gene_type:complete